ncbi:hypothetical protein [Anaerovibrio sp.]|uniref:Nmad3 family putative nucleotide modification protein n=1 Tax=Anaerovibrio sp. TaxID=1872532 RepID=UPI003F16A1BE
MKIILSRKGFDSKYGGIASPIFDGKPLLSLPIPCESSGTKYSDLKDFYGKSYSDIIMGLSRGKGARLDKKVNVDECHLDPDLKNRYAKAKIDWKPAFGQCDQAESHLLQHGVEKGDLFLFYGWFRHADFNTMKYKSPVRDLHVIWGYLQVGKILDLSQPEDLKQAKKEYSWHPHIQFDKKINKLYIPSDNLSIENMPSLEAEGYGIFDFSLARQLTAQDSANRCEWDFGGYRDTFKKVKMTYHDSNSYGWPKDKDDKVGVFRAAPRGQEFIFEYDENMKDWLAGVLGV